jgi:hypothetical protein
VSFTDEPTRSPAEYNPKEPGPGAEALPRSKTAAIEVDRTNAPRIGVFRRINPGSANGAIQKHGWPPKCVKYNSVDS